jgi:hypothetical protein
MKGCGKSSRDYQRAEHVYGARRLTHGSNQIRLFRLLSVVFDFGDEYDGGVRSIHIYRSSSRNAFVYIAFHSSKSEGNHPPFTLNGMYFFSTFRINVNRLSVGFLIVAKTGLTRVRVARNGAIRTDRGLAVSAAQDDTA